MIKTSYIPRLLFHVTEIEKRLRRRHHLNLNSDNAKWIWTISEAYFCGYNLSLKAGKDFKKLVSSLDQVVPELRGFAYEGAGTGLGILEILSPFHKQDLSVFLNEYASKHLETTSAGIGLAYARLGKSLKKKLECIDKRTSEFIIDGHSFYFGCLKNTKITSIKPPSYFSKEDKNIFYRGIGRSLWFRTNGNIISAISFIKDFPQEKQYYLWMGFSIACAYAGKVEEIELRNFLKLDSSYHQAICEGFRIAHEARISAKIQTIYTTSVYAFGNNILQAEKALKNV